VVCEEVIKDMMELVYLVRLVEEQRCELSDLIERESWRDDSTLCVTAERRLPSAQQHPRRTTIIVH